ncbi:hypothetical protein [Wolbachia endosymbiont (group A) of Ennomos erosarius]|uniref:hypothetical protein n=2 Tax=unclassified Wolbachia TaxID=2640676 RepID=UPI00397D489A
MPRHWDPSKTVSFQYLTLESSFLYKFTKSASFYNAKPILTKPNALLAIKFPGSQCLGTGMTGEGGYWNDTFVFEAKPAITFLRKQMFVQLCISYFHDTICCKLTFSL